MKSLLSLSDTEIPPHGFRDLNHTGNEPDDLTRLAACICDAPAALVCLRDGNRLSFGSRYGFRYCPPPGAFPFDLSLNHPGQVTMVPDTTVDPRFRDHSLVTCPPYIRFYAGAPMLTATGHPLGTLCILDYRPRELPADKIAALAALAREREKQLQQEQALTDMNTRWRQLMAEQERLKTANARLAVESLRDPLTGIGNRRAFDRQLRLEMERAGRTGGELSLALIDIDNFKTYNDHHGHPAGDGVLTRLAGVLADNARIYDFAARLGGDEFALLLPEVGESNTEAAGERFRQLVAAADWQHRPVTASIGIATRGTGGGLTPESLVSSADQALYLAKRLGRNRMVLVSEKSLPRTVVATHFQ